MLAIVPKAGALTLRRLPGEVASVVLEPPAPGAHHLEARQGPDEPLHGIKGLCDHALASRCRGHLDDRTLMQVLEVGLGDSDRKT